MSFKITFLASLMIDPSMLDICLLYISSKKILDKLGFKPLHSIEEAVVDLKQAFERGLLIQPLENEKYFNIKTMQKIKLI